MKRNRILLGMAFAALSYVATRAQETSPPAIKTQDAADVSANIEVAVVKPHPPAVQHNNFSFSRNRIELEDQPVFKLIAFAYALNPHQIAGAPAWATDDHWDISGTTNLVEDATLPQEQQLVRQLLRERFGLRLHHETRVISAYALRLEKERPRLAPAADTKAQPMEWTQGHGWERTENFRNNSISDFILFQQLFTDRPIVDRTGLAGRYDFKLTYSYGNPPTPDANAAPELFTAIRDQLGLKLESVKAPVKLWSSTIWKSLVTTNMMVFR